MVHSIPRIQDHLPAMKMYPNRFARTKASIRSGGIPSAANPPNLLVRSPQQAGSHFKVSASGAQLGSQASGQVQEEEVTYNQLIKEGDVVLLDIVRRSGLGAGGAKSFVRAGPREEICWAPGEAVAAIVTCGGCQLDTEHTP